MSGYRKKPKVCEQSLSGFVGKSANWKISGAKPERAQASRLDLPMDFREQTPGYLLSATSQSMGPTWHSVERVRPRLPPPPEAALGNVHG